MELVGLVITLLTVLLSLVVTLVAVVVSLVMTLLPVALVVFLVKRLADSDTAVVIAAPTLPTTDHVKVGRCPSCGANRSRPSRSAYVHCEACGQLMDWDFRAAMADRRSKAPGPAYEQLTARLRPRLQQAKAGEDRKAYEAVQRELWTAYAKACPAACPPRIGDAAYRDRWVAWSARSQTLQDLDPGCAETFAAQQAATAALQWDRSNPFQPKIQVPSYHALFDAVEAHQQRVNTALEPLLPDHPDRPSGEVFRKIGMAVFVQGWLPYLPDAERDATIERAGLSGEYVAVRPADLTSGSCPDCTAPLEVVANAKRVVCDACGHNVAVNGGSLPCHGCGATIDIPAEGARFVCPYCDAAVQRIGL